MRSWPLWCVPALALLAPAGCSEPGVTSTTVRRAVPVSEVPEPVLKAARKDLPGVGFTEAWKNLEKGQTLQSYELRGRNARGKIREVRVSTDGKVLERE